jgi:hypothetical protein
VFVEWSLWLQWFLIPPGARWPGRA